MTGGGVLWAPIPSLIQMDTPKPPTPKLSAPFIGWTRGCFTGAGAGLSPAQSWVTLGKGCAPGSLIQGSGRADRTFHDTRRGSLHIKGKFSPVKKPKQLY